MWEYANAEREHGLNPRNVGAAKGDAAAPGGESWAWKFSLTVAE